MRRSGMLPYAWLVDYTRWQRRPATFDSISTALQVTAEAYRKARPLRDYQYSALVEIFGAIAAGQNRVVAALPTGAGKTRIAAEICKRALSRAGDRYSWSAEYPSSSRRAALSSPRE